MTFSATVPLSSDSPAIFPAQNQTNMSRLKTIMSADHQFNNTATANDGYHNLVHLTVQAPSLSLPNTGRMYVKSTGGLIQLFYMDDAGREYQVTPGVIAAVNFNGLGGIGLAQTIRSAYNVTSVSRESTTNYGITFGPSLPPNANYIVSVTGMSSTNNTITAGAVIGSVTYSASVTTGFVRVGFNTAVIMGNVLVYSI